ncbi:LytR/AlgR family response regulator transcription factor [Hymenobacter armeniacus]|uniref:Response regulator n=1 Tax=Hymenobacter armeniacus TaxID=2771358 RepID=A0ABR8JS57_9BACT|nr:response regulator [Hymenobacter armeniacus]MBD2721636.1 response regulator [Hymenobacter armeniacus]
MPAPLQLLIIEDEAVLALDLRATLQAEGYGVVGIAASGPRALELFAQHPVDGVLCDIHLQGPWDGIETARRLLAVRPVPLIYLTALADQPTLDAALTTAPAAYLPKPVSAASLRAALALALHAIARPAAPAPPEPAASADALTRDTILQLEGHVFIKDNNQFVRIPLADILLLEADNTYTTLVTPTRKYALRLTLGAVLERLHFAQLVRVHRSFAVNIQRVESFSDTEATVAGQAVPLGRQYREAFLKQFQFR